MRKSQADARLAVTVGVEVGDADFLLKSGDFVEQKNSVADSEFCFEKNQCTALIEEHGFGFFLEGAAGGSKSVYDYRNVNGSTLSGSFATFGRGRKDAGVGEGGLLRFLGIVER